MAVWLPRPCSWPLCGAASGIIKPGWGDAAQPPRAPRLSVLPRFAGIPKRGVVVTARVASRLSPALQPLSYCSHFAPDSEIPSLSHTRILLKSKETENNAFSGKFVDLSLSPLCVSWGSEIAACWGLPLAGSWPRASRLPSLTPQNGDRVDLRLQPRLEDQVRWCLGESARRAAHVSALAPLPRLPLCKETCSHRWGKICKDGP